MKLPESIQNLLPSEAFSRDETGKSGAAVLLYPDRVLKIMASVPEAREEKRMLSWLQGRLPVPELLAWEEEAGKIFLLMSRLEGQMACDDAWMSRPGELTELLARGMKMLWDVDVSDCPVDRSLETKLALAEENVLRGEVDLEDTQPGTFGPGGFRDPEQLLCWLRDNRPREEMVLSHGDFCLPNVFLKGKNLSGFLDLGRCGVADRWCDIAICLRSLRSNFGGAYGHAWPGFSEERFFGALGLAPDWEKIRYYILLDELF